MLIRALFWTSSLFNWFYLASNWRSCMCFLIRWSQKHFLKTRRTIPFLFLCYSSFFIRGVILNFYFFTFLFFFTLSSDETSFNLLPSLSSIISFSFDGMYTCSFLALLCLFLFFFLSLFLFFLSWQSNWAEYFSLLCSMTSQLIQYQYFLSQSLSTSLNHFESWSLSIKFFDFYFNFGSFLTYWGKTFSSFSTIGSGYSLR